jgi:hypothetical protein
MNQIGNKSYTKSLGTYQPLRALERAEGVRRPHPFLTGWQKLIVLESLL